MTGFFGPGGPGGPGGPDGPGGSGPFDDFLARYFGAGGGPSGPVHRVDITRLMSEQARQLVAEAANKCTEWGSTDLDTEHLLWAATQLEPTRELLSRSGADPEQLGREVESYAGGGTPPEHPSPPRLTPAAKRALLDAHQVSRAVGSSYIGPEHLLLALSANTDSVAGQMLHAAHATPDGLQRAAAEGPQPSAEQGRRRAGAQSKTPNLDQYGNDLTESARAGKVDPVVGREDEIEQTVEVLSRRTKNNPVLIGEAGVGKTAIVEGLAQRIVDDDVPDALTGSRVMQLEISALVAGTRYRGDFEERMNKIVDEIRENSSELIVFIDELHTVVGAGGAEGSMGAGNILKPALSRGELHVIGATTLDEYRKNIEQDPALERRFQPIQVPEPSVEDAVKILYGLRDRYEAHHQVRFTDEALTAAVELSARYVSDRFLPDKAIDLVDQAGARVRLRSGRSGDVRAMERQIEQLCRDKDQAVAAEQYERAGALRDQAAELRSKVDAERGSGRSGRSTDVLTVTDEDIAEVVSRNTGIPVSQLTEAERDRLLRLEDHLHRRVVGQDDAVRSVAEAVRRSRAGLADPDRPSGSFLFLGPTGVGKTELARALAEALFGEQERMIRVDMSEFSERHTTARLVGAPPGYVGYDEAGQLTEAVRRNPYSVVLLDEIEKAHPEVFNILLQVLDDGRLTDGQGRTVDFKNTVLIMTSNLGSELISSKGGGLGFRTPGKVENEEESGLRDRLMRQLRESFRPEFLNRIDDIIVFRRLDDEQLRQITELLVEDTRRRARAKDIDVELSPAAVDWLSQRGHQPEFGARPMRRTIQQEVDNELARLLLDDRLPGGGKVEVDVAEDRLTFNVTETGPRDDGSGGGPSGPSGQDGPDGPDESGGPDGSDVDSGLASVSS